MIYAHHAGAQSLDWRIILKSDKPELTHADMVKFASDWATWPEAQIDYETERHADGYPIDATMYELNDQFSRCIERHEYSTAFALLEVIETKAEILHKCTALNAQYMFEAA
jgi:hypothetical protein